MESRCDKYQMNSQATSTKEDEKQQKSHGAGVDREEFMEVVGPETGHKAWIESVQKEGHLPRKKWEYVSGGGTGQGVSGHSERTEHTQKD